MPESNSRSHLKRLPSVYYRGESSYVHWTMTIDKRRTGWLDSLSHARLREALLHSLCKYEMLCPMYSLMPDHGHFLLIGHSESSDQLRAISHFRRQWNQTLRPNFELQHQCYDHVLRERDRTRDAFQAIAHYISQNPVRAGFVEEVASYPYWGAIFPGRPNMDPRADNFWKSFWMGWKSLREEGKR